MGCGEETLLLLWVVRSGTEVLDGIGHESLS